MAVTLAWLNAVALTNAPEWNTRIFENVGFAAPSFPICLLARFQIDFRPSPLISTGNVYAPLVASDPVPQNMLNAFEGHIEGACKAGALRSEQVARDDICKGYQEWTVTATDFAAWLDGQGMKPSPHIAAWCKAQNVGGAGAAAETTAERNARWLKVWDEVSPDHAPGSQAQAIKNIVNAEGVKSDTVKAALQKAKQVRADLCRDGGVTPIKPGKNSANRPFG